MHHMIIGIEAKKMLRIKHKINNDVDIETDSLWRQCGHLYAIFIVINC